MFPRSLTLVIVPHADAGDRKKWTLDHDVRPLSPTGREQAAELAYVVGKVDAVFSSPALRCVQTMEPIAVRSGGMPIVHREELREIAFVTEHRAWDRWHVPPPVSEWNITAAGLGRFLRLIDDVSAAAPDGGRVALGPHGDLAPLVAIMAAAAFGCDPPPPIARGGAHEIDASTRAVRSIGALLQPPV